LGLQVRLCVSLRSAEWYQRFTYQHL